MIDIRWSKAARDAIWAAGVQPAYRQAVAATMTPPDSEQDETEALIEAGVVKAVTR